MIYLHVLYLYLNVTVPSLTTIGQGVDEPLSETGFKQAAAAGIFLNNVKFTHVFSSDLMRTKQVCLKSRFPLELKSPWLLP